ncbi:MAG: cell division protein ZapB [Magnetococcus sp. DMHC-8]
MNLAEQQTPSSLHHEQVAFAALIPAAAAPVATPVSINPLAQLETRLNGMAATIITLKNKVTALQEIVAHREQRITALELENASLRQQMDGFTSSHSQLLEGLSDMLARFPTEESLIAQQAETTTQVDLMTETMGTA